MEKVKFYRRNSVGVNILSLKILLGKFSHWNSNYSWNTLKNGEYIKKGGEVSDIIEECSKQNIRCAKMKED